MSGGARRRPGRRRSTSPSGSISSPRSTPTKVAQLDDVQQRALADGKAWKLLGTREGCSFPDDIVHFGYRDNIMQPRFEGIHDPQRHADGQPMAPLGTVLLGHPTNLEGLMWRVPQPVELGTQRHLQRLSRAEAGRGGLREVSRSGRVRFARRTRRSTKCCRPAPKLNICQVLSIAPPSRHAALREVVAANLCGRWRDGTPLALSADTPDPNVDQAKFDYDRQFPLPLRSPYPPVQPARRADRATGGEQQPASGPARRTLWTAL